MKLLKISNAQRENLQMAMSFFAIVSLVMLPVLYTYSALIFVVSGIALIAVSLRELSRTHISLMAILAIPVYCVLSSVWSIHPENTIRYSIQLVLTVFIAISIYRVAGARGVISVIFCAYAVGMLWSIFVQWQLSFGARAWNGMFASKNAFAVLICIFALSGIAIASDQRAPRYFRIGAGVTALISFPILLKTQSVGTLTSFIPAVVASLAIIGLSRIKAKRRELVIAVSLLGAFFIAYSVVLNLDSLMDLFFATSGKNSTFTGRTYLWSVGGELIDARPLLGVGFHGFWVAGYWKAEQLWSYFDVPSGAGFSFHNTYITNAVDLGLIGVSIQCIFVYGSLLLSVASFVIKPRTCDTFFIPFLIFIIIRSFEETDIFYEFNLATIITVFAYLYNIERIKWSSDRRVRLNPYYR